MQPKISVVINSLNEEGKIRKAIESVKWADEVIVCDMYSEDKTVSVAKQLGAKVCFHKRENCVEPARNFAISKASNEWILILDPDEQVPASLADRLQEIANNMKQTDYIRIPRKNFIFNHLMQAAMWWPDYNIRFFKKGKVEWGNKIHRPPQVAGQGLDLPAEERFAIVHHSYETISQFITRMDRYTDIQADELKSEGCKFDWKDIFSKPLSEFLSRFFANSGYKDGLHGLVLSFLQAFSFMVMYLKLWEKNKFTEAEIGLAEINEQKNRAAAEINYWIKQSSSENLFKKIFRKIRS